METSKYPRQIAEQLSQLRDLLIVIERADEKAPDVLYQLAIEKSRSITALVEEWRTEVGPPSVEVPSEYEVWADNYERRVTQETHCHTPQEEDEMHNCIPEAQQISIDCDQDEQQQHIGVFTFDDDIELSRLRDNVDDDNRWNTNEEAFGSELTQVPQSEVVEESTEALIEDDLHNEIVEEENAIDFIVMNDDDEVNEMIVLDDELEVVEEDVAATQPDEDDTDAEDTEQEELIETDDEEVDWYNRGEPLDSEPLTIGEKLSMNQAKELRKALSLNDRFRFRRELFGNSDVTMNNTLNLIDTMTDYSEACEYLLQDLGWSTSEPVVQEFLELVDRHFKQKVKK